MPDDFFEFLVATDTLDDFLGLKEEYKNKEKKVEDPMNDISADDDEEELEETETNDDKES